MKLSSYVVLLVPFLFERVMCVCVCELASFFYESMTIGWIIESPNKCSPDSCNVWQRTVFWSWLKKHTWQECWPWSQNHRNPNRFLDPYKRSTHTCTFGNRKHHYNSQSRVGTTFLKSKVRSISWRCCLISLHPLLAGNGLSLRHFITWNFVGY